LGHYKKILPVPPHPPLPRPPPYPKKSYDNGDHLVEDEERDLPRKVTPMPNINIIPQPIPHPPTKPKCWPPYYSPYYSSYYSPYYYSPYYNPNSYYYRDGPKPPTGPIKKEFVPPAHHNEFLDSDSEEDG
jgi:hypothetical protein